MIQLTTKELMTLHGNTHRTSAIQVTSASAITPRERQKGRNEHARAKQAREARYGTNQRRFEPESRPAGEIDS